MSPNERRKSRIQAYPVPMVEQAIAATVYGEDNQRIVRDLYLADATYEQAAEHAAMTPSGLYKRMRRVMPPVEDYLKRLN